MPAQRAPQRAPGAPPPARPGRGGGPRAGGGGGAPGAGGGGGPHDPITVMTWAPQDTGATN
ncbi:hypothetical protein, partial [Streptomyces sp. IBSBF 2394]|uniref:hypothetical protein n=1 Tax=Streptomyces sp. IBSBF 2394 TaxID=2903532 RepID=UPI003FA7EC63